MGTAFINYDTRYYLKQHRCSGKRSQIRALNSETQSRRLRGRPAERWRRVGEKGVERSGKTWAEIKNLALARA